MGEAPQSGSLSERGKEAEQQSLVCSNLKKKNWAYVANSLIRV